MNKQNLVIIFLLYSTTCQNFKSKFNPSKSLNNVEEDGINEDPPVAGFHEQASTGSEGQSSEQQCDFTALYGRLFNESLREKILNHRQNNEDVKIEVHFVTSSNWIVYDENSAVLLGVPMKDLHDGPVNFIVLVKNQENISKLPCIVKVVSKLSIERNMESDFTENGCLRSESTVIFGVKLDANPDKISFLERINLVYKLQIFFSKMKINHKEISLEMNNHLNYHAFMSGHGSAPSKSDSISNFYLSWWLACGSDSINLDNLELLEEIAQNGSLATVFGYDVIEWRVENRNSENFYNRRLEPSKRSARFVTPDRFLSFPINTYESYPGFKPIDDITNRNPDLSSPFLPPHIALQPSPTTLPPTFDMSLMTTKSTLQRTTISSDHVKLGDKPLSTRPIVYIYSRTYFELPISNLFSINSIQMSGLSTVMSLNLSAMSSTICNIECDGQLIRGYISPSVAKKQNILYNITIPVKSGKTFVSKTVTFHVLPRPVPTTHKITMFMRTKQIQLSKAVIATQFFQRLVRVLGVQASFSLQPPGRITSLDISFLNVSHNAQRVSITWFDNQLNSTKHCDKIAIDALLSKLIGSFPQDLYSRQFQADIQVKEKFEPEFKLKKIRLYLLGPCKKKKNTNTKVDFKPPLIVPPFPPKTNKSYSTTMVGSETTDVLQRTIQTTLHSIRTIELPARVGTLSVTPIKKDLFFKSLSKPNTTNFRVDLFSDSDNAPLWLRLDPQTWTLVFLPKQQDLFSFSYFNSSHQVWRGYLLASNETQTSSKKVLINIYVTIAPYSGDKYFETFSPVFETKIVNYKIRNFTVLDIQRLFAIITELYDDTGFNNVYVRSLEAGSVIITWLNNSINNKENGCQYEQRSRHLLFDDGEIKPFLFRRLSQAGFKISSTKWKKLNFCPEKVAEPQNLTPTIIKATSTTMPETKISNDKKQIKNNDNITIILIVITVCIVTIFILVLLKYRMKNCKFKTSSQTQQVNKKSEKTCSENPHRYKKGTRVIFNEDSGKEPHSFQNHVTTSFTTDKMQTFVDGPTSRPPPPLYKDKASN